MPSLQAITALLSHYGYYLFLPAVIIEGPIVTVIAGFLASTGIMNIYVVYVLAVIGDVVGDAIYYWIGRAGRHTIIPKYGRFLGVTEERIKFAEEHYKNHLWKTMIFGKITQAPILILIVVAGAIKTNFWEFITVIFFITLPKVLVFILVGYFMGQSYAAIGHSLDLYLGIMWVVIIVGLVIYKFRSRSKVITKV